MLVLLVALVLIASPAWAVSTTYFADATRPDDSSTCVQAQTLATAKKSVTAAIACMTNAQADIVEVVGNGTTYSEAAQMSVGKSGPGSGSYMTIRGYIHGGTQDRPILCVTGLNVPTDDPANGVFKLVASPQSWLYFQSFEVCLHMGFAQLSGGPSGTGGNIVVDNVIVNGRPNCCLSSTNPASLVSIDGNILNYGGPWTIKNSWSKAGPGACVANPLNCNHIFADHFNAVTIQHNQFDGGATPLGGGILLKHQGDNMLVERNFFNNMDQHCLETTFTHQGSGGSSTNSMQGGIVRFNVCRGALNNYGIAIEGDARAVPACGADVCTVANWQIYNNTICGSGAGGRGWNLAILGSTGYWKVYNNLVRIAATGGSARYASDVGSISSPRTADYNGYSRNSGSAGSDFVASGSNVAFATWQGTYSSTTDQDYGSGANVENTNPHITSNDCSSSTVTDYRSTDTVGTLSWLGGSTDGTTGGGRTPIGAWVISSDQIGLPISTGTTTVGGQITIKGGVTM